MKRVISLVLVLLLVLGLGMAAAGCKSSGAKEDEGGKYGDSIPGGVGDVSEEVLAALTESGNIKTYSCHVDPGTGKSENAVLHALSRIDGAGRHLKWCQQLLYCSERKRR